jgi:hypothetical protein
LNNVGVWDNRAFPIFTISIFLNQKWGFYFEEKPWNFSSRFSKNAIKLSTLQGFPYSSAKRCCTLSTLLLWMPGRSHEWRCDADAETLWRTHYSHTADSEHHWVRQQCATILEPTNSLLWNIGARIVINRGSFIRASLDIDESDPTRCIYMWHELLVNTTTRERARCAQLGRWSSCHLMNCHLTRTHLFTKRSTNFGFENLIVLLC